MLGIKNAWNLAREVGKYDTKYIRDMHREIMRQRKYAGMINKKNGA